MATLTLHTPAELLVLEAFRRIQPALGDLSGGVMLVGGMMTRLWLAECQPELPQRATADVDLGASRHPLRLYGDTTRITPALAQCGFEPGGGPGRETFRFAHREQPDMIIDILAVPGEFSTKKARQEIEPGVEALTAAGLDFAFQQGVHHLTCTLVNGNDPDDAVTLQVPMPTLAAAFVLKGSLRRMQPSAQATDTADAISLAAAVLTSADAVSQLADSSFTCVAKALALLVDMSDVESAATRRVRRGLEIEDAAHASGISEWASQVARRLTARVEAARIG